MGFLIQLCQHSSDTNDLFLPRNSKSFSDISVTELICFLTFVTNIHFKIVVSIKISLKAHSLIFVM